MSAAAKAPSSQRRRDGETGPRLPGPLASGMGRVSRAGIGDCIRQSRTVHIFGLTGGIASGKSTVAARFRAHALPVIDADLLAREVVAPGTEGLAEIVRTFGAGVVGQDGALDRPALARIVFSDEASRRKLNGITHSRIMQGMAERAEELGRAGEPLACFEAALLVESNLADAFRPLVVVSCSEAVQLARIVARDAGFREDALARIRAQKPLAAKLEVADYVIDTSGTLEESAERADQVLRAVSTGAGIDPRRYFPS
jgi:dephospho-CoA kinase